MINPLTNTLWTEKYRPDVISNYIGNDDLKETMIKYINEQDIPHLLFYARAGTGKTTLGKILVKAIDCDVLYINASDENNVETIRNKIKTFVSSVGFKKWKVVFLDEADYLTQNAQAILRNLMEQFSKNSRFILTCNYPEKIIDPIKSRCNSFEIYPPDKKEVAKKIVDILTAENIKFELKDVGAIVQNNYPDIRRVISATQRQVTDGVLKLSSKQSAAYNYMDKILSILKTETDAKKIYTLVRQTIADSKIRTFDELYRYLYDNIDEIAPNGKQAGVILEIAKAMREDSHCVDKEINIMAMFIEIIALLKQ